MARRQPDERAIFNIARRLDSPESRDEYLRQICGDDHRLFDRVAALLQGFEDGRSFLESPPGGVAATIEVASITERPGTMVGPYKIREELAEGGMGMVYVAEQTEPVRRRVALKIIKPGMATKDVVARFEAERQALAMMDHPNIAKVLGAGATENGRPYFVMELVHGIPITEFCDDQKLSTRQRLQLFVDVCRAVQHAHQKGIIHRDLKPSNVMVTMHDDKMVPKVIDFGVSKALGHKLTDNTVYTAYGQMVGTPLYMSPEQTQMCGLDVDTRSDVYSLGVLLYELLTGTTPFDKETLKNAEFDEMRRMIREDEPPRPSKRISTLNAESLSTVSAKRKVDPRKMGPSFCGELDWIVMKALEKDRTRRYETATGLASDVQHYLDDEPVAACPPSAAYRFSKFARRNQASLATASMVLAALVLGLVGTAWQAVRANAERDDAVEAKQLADDRLGRAKNAEDTANRLRRETEYRLGSSYVDRAQALCEQGEIGRGMLWLAHSLQVASSDATDLQRVIRTNLAAWGRQLHSLRALMQQQSPVVVIVFSADGSRILTNCSDGSICLWDAASGRQMGKLRGQDGRVIRLQTPRFLRYSLALSPDGSRILTPANEGRAQLWNAATMEPIGEPLQHAPIGEPVKPKDRPRIVAFSPDGSRIVTASGWSGAGNVRLWDAATLKPIGEPFPRYPLDFRFCPGGLRVLAQLRPEGGDGSSKCQLWDVQRDEPIGPSVDIGPRPVTAISPDGSMFATAAGGRITLWQAGTGKPAIAPIVHGGVVLALAFSPDGSRLHSGGNTRASMLWDTSTGRPVGTPLRQQSSAYALAFSPDGARMATGSEDGSVRVWDVAQDKSVGQVIRHNDGVVAAAYSIDGLRIMTESDSSLQLRDATNGEAIGTAFPRQGAIGRILFSPDGSRVLILGRAAKLCDVATGQLIGSSSGSLHDVAFSPDGKRMLVGFADGTVRLWDLLSLAPYGVPLHHQNIVTSVAFSPDGSRFLTCSLDQAAQLWDTATQKRIGPLLKHNVWWPAASFNPDGTEFLLAGALLAAGDGERVQFWEAPPGPLEGDRERIQLWTEVITGLQLHDSGGITSLDGPAWQERYRRLQQLGGPPASAPLPPPA